jgi:hypothetical protein
VTLYVAVSAFYWQSENFTEAIAGIAQRLVRNVRVPLCGLRLCVT